MGLAPVGEAEVLPGKDSLALHWPWGWAPQLCGWTVRSGLAQPGPTSAVLLGLDPPGEGSPETGGNESQEGPPPGRAPEELTMKRSRLRSTGVWQADPPTVGPRHITTVSW